MVDGVAGRGYGRLGIQTGQFTRQSPPVRSDPLVVSTDSLIVPVDCRSDALVVASNCVIVFSNRLLSFLLSLTEIATNLRGRISACHAASFDELRLPYSTLIGLDQKG